MFKVNKIDSVLFLISICICFFLIFILNRLYPLYADDWIYTFVFGENSSRRVSGICDIIVSQYNHYMLWGGRSIVHSIAQMLLLLPSFLLDLINTLAFLLFILILYKIANKGNRINAFVFLIIVIFIWFFLPSFAGTVIWITGSANYLWGTLIALLFIAPYCSFFKTEYSSNTKSLWKALLFFIFGIIAGWTNENMAVAIIFMIAVLCIYQKRKGTLPYWMIGGFVGLCVGCTIMLLAPGNYIRSEVISESLHLSQVSFFIQLKHRLTVFPSVYGRHLLLLLIIYFVVLALYFKATNRDENRMKIIFISALFIVSAHIAFFVLVATPIFPERALFCIVTFMVLAISIVYANIQIRGRYSRILNGFFILLICSMFCYDYYRKYPSIYLIHKTFNEREISLKEQKDKGIDEIIFKGRIGIHYKFGFMDLEEDPCASLNQQYARFYNVRSVRILPAD